MNGRVGERRGALIDKGLAFSPAHGDTAFTVPLFDKFLRREMPGWRRRAEGEEVR